jgi:putative Mg2+ transporter-C (MgtC) family protein
MMGTFVLVEALLYNFIMIEFFTTNSEIIIRLLIAVALGLVIGAERLFVHKEAGMKTHALVSMGSALFVIMSEMLAVKYINLPGFNPAMMPSQIIVGIGFLGAGSIMLQGSRLRGLTTAGGLWVTAGLGMAAGFGFYGLACIATALLMFVFVVVKFLEDPIRKISDEMDPQS